MEQPLLNNAAPSVDDVRQSFSLGQQSSRWALSLLCIALLMASLKIYESKGNLTHPQINTFTAITTVLSLLLALGFFDAFKDLANALRWRILAMRGWDDLEKKLIRKIARWTAVIKLGLVEFGWKKWRVVSACVFWIILIVTAQTAVALIGQIPSLQGGTDWTGTYVTLGQVNASQLTCYYHHIYLARSFVCDQNPETVHGIVHAYGEAAFASLTDGHDCEYYNNIGDVLHSQANPKYFCRRTPGQQEFAYRFLEYNPRDHQRAYPFLTNRTITASAGKCYNYSVEKVDKGSDKVGIWSNYTYTNQTVTDIISLPVKIDTFDGTVYIYRGSETPQNATTSSCGDRCIWMWAHQTKDQNNPSNFYQCPVTVNVVQNSEQDVHDVSNDIARLAASAIGLEGGKSDQENGWSSFVFYPISNAWDIHNQPADNVGANMAEFALGSIATMATNNPLIQTGGNLPILGSRLQIDWAFAIALLVCIASVHSALFILAICADRWNRNNSQSETELLTNNDPNLSNEQTQSA